MLRFVLCPDLRRLPGRLSCRLSRLLFARPGIVLALAMACLGTATAYAGTCTVNVLTDTGTGPGSAGELRYCLNNLSSGTAASTNTITFNVTGAITLGGALPAINDGVTITGPGANLLTISGAGKYQVLAIGTSLSGAPSVALSGLTIADGYSSQSSGGLTSLSAGALTVSNCIFSGNTGLAGGAISVAGVTPGSGLTAGNSAVTVTGSTFYGNFAEYGGAILAESLALTDSTIFDNSTYYYGAVTTAGTSTATDNTFYENSTTYGYGGGIYNANGALTANNNIFSGNSITYGVAPGSGGAGIDNGSGGTVNGSNNVYYNNLTNGTEDDCAGCTTGGPGSDGNVDAASNPLTLPFGYYGGSTQTLALAFNSPAICAGSASLASSAGLTADQRGFPIKAGNCSATQVDAGSVQTNALTVTNLNGTSDASPDCTSGTGTSCSLVDAMAQASTDGSADVSFLSTLTSAASPGTIPLSAGLTITGAIDLRGPGANQLTVSGGNSASVGSVFTVNSGAIALLSGLTVANGNTSSDGGGIDNSGTLTILDSAITANTASDGGGGIYSSGTLAIEDSTLSGNTGGSGGGIYNSGTLAMTESTVSGNSDTGSHAGGGIYTSNTSAITGSTIAGNTDNGNGGGGIYVTGSLILANSIVAGNNSSNSGANISGSYTGNGGNVIGGSTNATNNTDIVTATAITLSPLQLNGLNATVQTMIPLPGSAAICAGLESNIPSGATLDERGYPNSNISYTGYSAASPCVDAGAVQTNYTAVAFVQQPAGATTSVNGLAGLNQLISPAPTVEVLETDTLLSGTNTDAVSGIPVTLSYSGGAGELMAPDNVLTETTTGDVATYSLAPNTLGTDFTLSTSAIAVVGSDSLAAVTSYDFNVVAAPTVTGISPASGATSGDTSVTITGTNLSSATGVSFGGVAAASFTVNSASQIAAVSPSVTGAQTVNITVTTPGGTSATSAADQFTYLVLTGTSLTPSVTPGTTFVYDNQPTISVAVNPSAATGTLTAMLDGSTALTITPAGGGVFDIALPGTPLTVGGHSIALAFTGTGSYASSTGSISLTVTGPNYVVNTTADDSTGTASNCPEGGASTPVCSLRDALAAAAAASGGSNITFSPTVFTVSNTAAQNTITLGSAGTLKVPSNTTIQGLTTGSGSTLTNLVTVSGASSYQIFSVNYGATAAFANLNMTQGGTASTLQGGAIYIPSGTVTVTNSSFSENSAMEGGAILIGSGTLTVTNSTFSGNSGGQGAAICSEGTVTVTNSTFSGNSVTATGGAIYIAEGTTTTANSTFAGNSAEDGGAIFIASGKLTVTNSTFTGNSATLEIGGAISNVDATVTAANNIFSGNSAKDFGGAIENVEGSLYTSYNVYYQNLGNGAEDDCHSCTSDTNSVSASTSPVSALSANGGPTETMIPLPGSAAICVGSASTAAGANITSDQRGVALNLTTSNASTYTGAGGYCPQGAIDAGAVQTDYALSFSTEPEPISPMTSIEPGANFQAGVTLDEDGSPFTAASETLPLTLTSTPSGATLTGGSATTSGLPGAGAGVASYTTLQVNETGTDDQLTTNLALNTAPSVSISATSSQFNVALPTPTVTMLSPAYGISTGGTSVTITGTNFSNVTAVSFGGLAAKSFTVNGTTSITATSPGGTGKVDVAVTANGETSATSAADEFTYLVPIPTSLTPAVTPGATFAYSQQPTVSVALTGSSETALSASDITATLDGSTALTVTAGTATNVFNIALPATPLTVGSHSIAVNFVGVLAGAGPYFAASNTTISLTVTVPNYVVTTPGDDPGNDALCTPQTTQGQNTTDTTCSLRDALLAAAAVGGANISFSSTVFSASNTAAINTIILDNGTLTVPSNTTIQGQTTGSGASLKNLVTISGANQYRIMDIGAAGSVTVTLSGLTLANGNSSGGAAGGILFDSGTLTVTACTFTGNQANGPAGAIYSFGTLTIANSTFTGNSAGFRAGAIFNAGTLTVTNSTFTGNSSPGNDGGAIFNPSTLTVTDSTFTGNSGYDGGAIFTTGSALIANNIFSGNNATDAGAGIDNFEGTGTANGSYNVYSSNLVNNTTEDDCNSCTTGSPGSNGNILAASDPLAPLGNYGGPTQTMIPLPGSPAICAGSASAAASAGIVSDQRGDALTLTTANASTYTGAGGYCPAGSIDAGAAQTDYSVKFAQQPSTVVQSATMSPAPTVELDESGTAFFDGTDTITIPLTLSTGSGTLTGGSALTSSTTGIATFSALSISLPGASDKLTASLALNPAVDPAPVASNTSDSFAVKQAVTQLAFSTAPALTVTAGSNAGSSIVVYEENASSVLVTTASDTITLTATGPNSYSKTYTAGASGGVATFNLSSAALTAAGGYSYTASIATDSSVTAATANETVDAGSPYAVSVVSGSGQSAVIGSAFAQPLQVRVEDQYTNPVAGATVLFAGPGSGASATFSTPAATASNGVTSITATANGTASATAYTVTASVAGAATSASLLLTNTADTTSLTVTPGAASIVYGQPETITAAITPSSIAGSAPGGSITFYDGTTPLTPASSVTSAQASYTVSVPTVATHHYYAQYSGDTNFKQSALTAATSMVVVSQATSTLNGPASTVSLTYGVGGTIPIPVTGEYSGTGIATPSGTVGYIIASGAVQTATISAGAATLTVPAAHTAGSYTVTVSYGGDTNYKAASSIQFNLSIEQATTTTSVTVSKTSITPGQSVMLTAKVSSTFGTPGGTVNFYDNGTLLNATPAALSSGVATYTTAALAAGISHSITATYSGNVDYIASSSIANPATTITVAPLDFTINLGGLSAQTVIPGQSVSFTFTVTPDYGSYAGTMTFTATGLPAGATATFSPASIAANGGPQTVTVTIQTAASTALEHAPAPPTSSGRRAAPLALAFLLLFGVGTLRKRAMAMRKLLCVVVLLATGAAAAFSLGGCGGGVSGYFAQPPQSYTITLTATAGGLNHSGNVTLNVQ